MLPLIQGNNTAHRVFVSVIIACLRCWSAVTSGTDCKVMEEERRIKKTTKNSEGQKGETAQRKGQKMSKMRDYYKSKQKENSSVCLL